MQISPRLASRTRAFTLVGLLGLGSIGLDGCSDDASTTNDTTSSSGGTSGNGNGNGKTGSSGSTPGSSGTPGTTPPATWTPTTTDGPPATCTTATESFGGLKMIACVPKGGEGKTGKPTPLVVALHGYTQSADAYRDTTEWHVLAGRYGFYVIYPVAPGARSWTWFSANRGRDQGDAASIVAMVDAMKAKHDIHPDLVFATGLSAGGFETVALLADYPDVFAAGAAVAGGAYGCGMGCMGAGSGGTNAAAVKAAFPTWWNDDTKRKPRLLVIQGDKDNVVAPSNLDETVKQWTSAIGTDAVADNATLGEPAAMKGYPYEVYSKDGTTIDVASVRVKGMAHGTPIEQGAAVDQGGKPGSYTFDVKFYSPYYAAKFFGIVP